METPCWSGLVDKKAFKTLAKEKWARRWLIFDGAEFTMRWLDREGGVVKGSFRLVAEDIEYSPCEDHKRTHEIKISSAGQTLFLCTTTPEDQNKLLQRLDAARRLKVASVSHAGTKFRLTDEVVSMGSGFSASESGAKVFTWGVGLMLGTNDTSINGMSLPQRVTTFRGDNAILSLSCGPEHAAGVSSDATTLLWGSNEFYQLAHSSDMQASARPIPVPVLQNKRVLQVACGGSHTLAVVAEAGSSLGGLYAWGTGTVGQLGVGGTCQFSEAPMPVDLSGREGGPGAPVASVYAGLVSSACITAAGACYVWGDASAGRLGLPGIRDDSSAASTPRFVNSNIAWTPTQVVMDAGVCCVPAGTPLRVVSLALGGSFTLFLVWTGPTAKGCLLLVSGALGADITRDTYGYPPTQDDSALLLDIDRRVRDVGRFMTPALVAPFYSKAEVLGVFAGARHAAVLCADSRARGAPRLYTAGKGWLGHEGTRDSVILEEPAVATEFKPVVGALAEEEVIDVGCGHSHTLARTADGRLFAWGRGDSGELGHGSLSDRSMPVALKPLAGHVWTAVDAGSYHSAGIATPGHIARASPEAIAASLQTRWTAVADAQEIAAGGARAGAGNAVLDAAEKKLRELARRVAGARWNDAAGELPPGWDYNQTADGEYYYLKPDGETTWDDPRVDFEEYVKAHIDAAHDQGVDLTSLL